MQCKRCGKNVPLHSKVCPGCGLSNPNYVPRPEEKPSASHSSTPRSTYSYSSTQPKSAAAPNPKPSQPRSTAAPNPKPSQPKSTAAPNPKPTQPKSAPNPVPPQAQSASKPASTGEGSSFMKFLLLVAVVVGIVFLLKNCDSMRLKGTWVASDGSSITFTDKDSGYITARGTMSSQTLNFTYFVDGDELEIKTEDSLYAYSMVVRFEFEIDGDTLLLTDLDSGMTERFTKR